MKCGACGYQHNEPMGGDQYILMSDDTEEFIPIQGNFTIADKHRPFNVKQVNLLACPKCNVVNMSKW